MQCIQSFGLENTGLLGLNASQQPGSYRGGHYDDDMSVLLVEGFGNIT